MHRDPAHLTPDPVEQLPCPAFHLNLDYIQGQLISRERQTPSSLSPPPTFHFASFSHLYLPDWSIPGEQLATDLGLLWIFLLHPIRYPRLRLRLRLSASRVLPRLATSQGTINNNRPRELLTIRCCRWHHLDSDTVGHTGNQRWETPVRTTPRSHRLVRQ